MMDLGVAGGLDTLWGLANGYKVVSVEANKVAL